MCSKRVIPNVLSTRTVSGVDRAILLIGNSILKTVMKSENNFIIIIIIIIIITVIIYYTCFHSVVVVLELVTNKNKYT
jgi:hypothetical protein